MRSFFLAFEEGGWFLPGLLDFLDCLEFLQFWGFFFWKEIYVLDFLDFLQFRAFFIKTLPKPGFFWNEVIFVFFGLRGFEEGGVVSPRPFGFFGFF